jgi:hypothetical protein
MTTYAADDAATLAEARDDYYRRNGFGADGGASQAWVDFKLGPIPMPFPNTAARRRAVRYHDLHHALTGYGTDILGEFEIGAWEVASGCADHWVAWQLNLAGMMAGLLVAPRRVLRAWRRGRQTRNLYRLPYDEALLGRRVGDVRHELGLDAPGTGALVAADVAGLVAASLCGLVIGVVMLALVLPAAIVANLAALSRRR